jgi:hypothetical protein
MKTRILAATAALLFVSTLATAQYKPKTTVDGKPSMEGFWDNQAGAAPWDIEPHKGDQTMPPGDGIIIDTPDKKIPYKPEALAKRNDLRDHHIYDDPQGHCAPSGVPRQTYTPFGFQFVQPRGHVVILYEAEHAYRDIRMDSSGHVPKDVKLWQGDSIGHWEGNTLVVDSTNFNGRTWLDMSGNFTTESLHVVERYIPVDDDTIRYEARIEDSTIYTKPYTVGFNLKRNKKPGYMILEFACHEGEQDLQHYTDDTGRPKK